ncbi:MAG: hypothetical protein LBC49_00895 [Bacteroidales bacterium]|jgi:hypothetical protein|nr:hypothetical protein [Bacteroidales bacterium]
MKTPELKALVSLLDEQNLQQYEVIRSQVIEQGVNIIPFIEEELVSRAEDELFKGRCEEITSIIYAKRGIKNLQEWKDSGSENLMKGYFYFSRIFTPNMQWKEIEKSIRKLEIEMWLEMNERMTVAEKINTINLLFYKKWNFSVVKYPTFISTVFSLFLGDTNSLALVYFHLMQKADIPCDMLVLWHRLTLFPILSNKISSNGMCLNPMDGGLFLSKEFQSYGIEDTQLIFSDNSSILNKYIESRDFFQISSGSVVYNEFYKNKIIDKDRFAKYFAEGVQDIFANANYEDD